MTSVRGAQRKALPFLYKITPDICVQMDAIDPYLLDPIVEGHGQDVNRDQESDDRLESPTATTQDDPELRHLLADAIQGAPPCRL